MAMIAVLGESKVPQCGVPESLGPCAGCRCTPGKDRRWPSNGDWARLVAGACLFVVKLKRWRRMEKKQVPTVF